MFKIYKALLSGIKKHACLCTAIILVDGCSLISWNYYSAHKYLMKGFFAKCNRLDNIYRDQKHTFECRIDEPS